MKHVFLIFTKPYNPEIHMWMVDEWIIGVKEFYRGKVSHECQIILRDLNQYIERRKKEGYTYLKRKV